MADPFKRPPTERLQAGSASGKAVPSGGGFARLIVVGSTPTMVATLITGLAYRVRGIPLTLFL